MNESQPDLETVEQKNPEVVVGKTRGIIAKLSALSDFQDIHDNIIAPHLKRLENKYGQTARDTILWNVASGSTSENSTQLDFDGTDSIELFFKNLAETYLQA